MTTENQAPEGGELPPPPHPDARVFTWTSRELAAIKRYGEECARAALAAQPQALTVALPDIDLCRLISAHEVYQYHPGALHEFAHAVIAEFCRVNGITAPKEPTNDR